MKNSFRNRQSNKQAARSGQRAGAMFAYFMVYVFLAGATTTAAGLMLHVMFQSRTADAKRADGIRQLLRMESQLRTDWQTAAGFEVNDQTFTINSTDQFSIVYSVEGDRVQRVATSEGDVQSTNRFQFAKDSRLEFKDKAHTAEDDTAAIAGVTFRLTSPVPRPKSVPKSEQATVGQRVEIFLASPVVAKDKEPS